MWKLLYNDLLLLLNYFFNNFNSFITSANTKLRLPPNDAYVSNYVAVIINILDLFFHVHTVHLDNYQSFFTNRCTIG